MQPYRVVVIHDDSNRTTDAVVVQLARAPDVGETLELPHRDTVIVRHVISGHADVVAGIVLAGPASA
jgi:hypothetical protein